MKGLSLPLITALLLSACSSQTGREFTTQDNIHLEQVIYLPAVSENSKTYTYTITGLEPKIVEGKIIAELRNQLKDRFAHTKVPLRLNEDTYDTVLRGGTYGILKWGPGATIPKYSKLNWNVTTAGLQMSYESIEDWSKYGRKAVAYQRFLYPFTFRYEPSSQKLYMTVAMPTQYAERNGNLGSESMMIPPYESAQLQQQITQVFSDIEVKRIGYYKDKTIKGDFIVNYRDDSVYANFIQLGVNNTVDHKIEKSAQFYLKRGDMQYTTRVDVYPYRDTKTKVIYESQLQSVQWIYNDGHTKFDKFPTNAEIKKMLQDIANG